MSDLVEQAETISPEGSGALEKPPEGGTILSVIERAAADPDFDPEKLEKLLAMHERVLDRYARQNYNLAMRAAQEEIKPVVRNRENESTRSKFADLGAISDDIDPIIHRNGFSLSYGSAESPLPGHYRVTCLVSHTGGHEHEYTADVPADTAGIKGSPNKTATHGWGSAMSYGRRYLKMMIFDVKLRDDDGNDAGRGDLVNEEQAATLSGLCQAIGADEAKFLQYLRVDSYEELPANQYDQAVNVLKQRNPEKAREFLTAGE